MTLVLIVFYWSCNAAIAILKTLKIYGLAVLNASVVHVWGAYCEDMGEPA
jgi:hypothetical protein